MLHYTQHSRTNRLIQTLLQWLSSTSLYTIVQLLHTYVLYDLHASLHAVWTDGEDTTRVFTLPFNCHIVHQTLTSEPNIPHQATASRYAVKQGDKYYCACIHNVCALSNFRASLYCRETIYCTINLLYFILYGSTVSLLYVYIMYVSTAIL